LPAGLTLDASTGVVTGTPTVPEAKTSYTVTMTDLAGRTTAALSVEVKKPASPPPPPPPMAKLKLKAGKLRLGKARAGMPFTVSMTVENASTGRGVKGQVACTGKLAGKLLVAALHSSTAKGKASCIWNLPKASVGKTFKGSITDHSKSAEISRSFSVKIHR
jgi:hypothetical protein